MALYEIVNPSDPVTLESEDLQAARLAVFILSSGRYGLNDESGKTVLGLFLFGLNEEGMKAQGLDLGAAVKDLSFMERMAAALESTTVCSLGDYKAATLMHGGEPEKVRLWNEAKRSSMNNICLRAREHAKHFRAMVAAARKASA